MAIVFRTKSPAYIWETSYPVLAGGIAFVLIIVYGAQLFGKLDAGKIELSNLYTAVAGLFAIITGFLATFYGSIQAIIDTRLKRIAKTTVFRRFVGYIKIATLAGFVIALASIPYIILTPTAGGSLFGRIVVAVWCGACVYGFALFIRVAGLLFFIFEHQPPEDDSAV
jgi:hypothetical protein